MNNSNTAYNNTNRAILLQTMSNRNLSQYCLRLISNIVMKSKDKEYTAKDITDIIHSKDVEQDIIDQLQLWYRYILA